MASSQGVVLHSLDMLAVSLSQLPVPLRCPLSGCAPQMELGTGPYREKERQAYQVASDCLQYLMYVPPDLCGDEDAPLDAAAAAPAGSSGGDAALDPSAAAGSICTTNPAAGAEGDRLPTAASAGSSSSSGCGPSCCYLTGPRAPGAPPPPRPCPLCDAAPAAPRMPAHRRVALGLLQRLCRVMTDRELCTAVATCVQQAAALKDPQREGVEGKRPDADRDLRTGCGAERFCMLYAAKLVATRHLRPGGEVRAGTWARVGDSEGGQLPSDAVAERLGSQAKVLSPDMRPEELLGFLLRVKLDQEGRQEEGQQGGVGDRGQEQGQRQEGSTVTQQLVCYDPVLLLLLVLVLGFDLPGTTDTDREPEVLLRPAVDVRLSNALLPPDRQLPSDEVSAGVG